MIRKFMLLIYLSVFLSACSALPPQATQTQYPTNTPLPTYTPVPTYTPLPTHTPAPTYTKQPTYAPIFTSTPTISTPQMIQTSSITEQEIYENKKIFSEKAKEYFEKPLGCIIAEWKENSFEFVCVKTIGYDTYADLINLAYQLTAGLGNQLSGLRLLPIINHEFIFAVTLMSEDEKVTLRSETSGDLLIKLLERPIISQGDWEQEAKIEKR